MLRFLPITALFIFASLALLTASEKPPVCEQHNAGMRRERVPIIYGAGRSNAQQQKVLSDNPHIPLVFGGSDHSILKPGATRIWVCPACKSNYEAAQALVPIREL